MKLTEGSKPTRYDAPFCKGSMIFDADGRYVPSKNEKKYEMIGIMLLIIAGAAAMWFIYSTLHEAALETRAEKRRQEAIEFARGTPTQRCLKAFQSPLCERVYEFEITQ